MGDIRTPPRCLFLTAVISRYPEALAWAQAQFESRLSAAALVSPAFTFDETSYYDATMGPQLLKQFLVFDSPFDPATLADWKITTNQWEADYAALGRHPEPRPLNLDPGYLTLAKLVLASTKDYAHRIYLRDGIFAEITLFFRGGGWQGHEWTFPDYRRADYHAFFTAARALLKGP